MTGNREKISFFFERLIPISLFLFAAILPFQFLFLPITSFIVLFWLSYVLSFKKERLVLLVRNKWFWLFFTLYLLQVISLLFTEHIETGERIILLKITLLLWPMGMASIPKISKKTRDTILAIFVISVSASAFVQLMMSLLNYINGAEISAFFGQYLAHWIMIPNHYMGLYVSFSIALLSIYLITNWRLINSKMRLFCVLLLGFLFLFLILLAVRIQIIALPIALLVLVIHFRKQIGFNLKHVIGIGLGLSGFIALLFALPETNKRIQETIDEVSSFNEMKNNKQTNHRVFLWKYGVQVIKENFWLGSGIGDADYELHEKLKDCDAKFWNGKRVYYLRERLFNYHNSFIQHFAANGIISFLIFLTVFIVALIWSLKKGDVVSMVFIVLCFVSFFTESMLERQAGVLFFSFFYSLLFININRGLTQKSNKENE